MHCNRVSETTKIYIYQGVCFSGNAVICAPRVPMTVTDINISHVFIYHFTFYGIKKIILYHILCNAGYVSTVFKNACFCEN